MADRSNHAAAAALWCALASPAAAQPVDWRGVLDGDVNLDGVVDAEVRLSLSITMA